MGVVYLAQNQMTKRRKAIKTLFFMAVGDTKADERIRERRIERFKKEIANHAKIMPTENRRIVRATNGRPFCCS